MPDPNPTKHYEYEKQFGARRSLLEILALQLKILCFLSDREELLSLGKREYFWGIVLVWLAGVARYSNDPTANVLARSGMESVFYVFFLAIFLWILMALIGARNFKFGRLVIFICMTAPPALLFGIPFGWFLSPYEADQAGAFLQLGVAAWRVALFAWFVHKIAELTPWRIAVALFLPLATIVSIMECWEGLVAKYSTMGGVRRELRKVNAQGWAPQQAAPAQIWSGTPEQQAAMQKQAMEFLDRGGMPPAPRQPHRTPAARRRSRHVTPGAFGWLSKQGAQLAERPDQTRMGMQVSFSKPPAYQETVNTPSGPVEIYWTVGTPGSPVPPGFQEITVNDPIQTYRNPIAKMLSPFASLCWYGSFPAGLAYLVFIFKRPKRGDQRECPEHVDSDDSDDEEDDEVEGEEI